MELTFEIPGKPQGKGRPIVTKHGTFTPQRTVSYENLIKVEYERQCGAQRFPDDTPLSMTIIANYAPPRSAPKKRRAEMLLNTQRRPMVKPDMDNVVKVVCDALNGLAYRDDVQIVQLFAVKRFAETESVTVTLREAEGFAPSGRED